MIRHHDEVMDPKLLRGHVATQHVNEQQRIGSDCSKALPRLVFVVAKKVREGLRIWLGLAWRAGLTIIWG